MVRENNVGNLLVLRKLANVMLPKIAKDCHIQEGKFAARFMGSSIFASPVGTSFRQGCGGKPNHKNSLSFSCASGRGVAGLLIFLLVLVFVCSSWGRLGAGVALPGAPAGTLRRLHHPWGRFEPGAWAVVKEVTETYSPEGTLLSETELKTTLVGIDIEGVTLQIEPKMIVGGKPMPVTVQRLRQGFHGELLDSPVQVVEDRETQLIFLGRPISCRVQKLTIQGASTRTEVVLYYGDSPPYVYRREIATTKLDDSSLVSSQIWEVTGRSCRLLSVIQDTYQIKITQRTQKGTRITLATISPEVPGGMIRQTSMEFSPAGQLLQKSNGELLEYGYDLKPPRGLLRFWRPRPFR